jgi:hypothetical protein
MNKLVVAVIIGPSLLLLGGCATRVNTVAVDTVVYDPTYPVVYDPGYSNDYVYSVGYYNNRPYWGNKYYYYNTGYIAGTPGYWGGGFYNGY